MAVLYSSTRGGEKGVSASQAILKGLACDGGLFVPNEIPVIEGNLSDWKELSYKELAYEVMKLYFEDFTEEELKNCIERAYDEKFDTDIIAPMTEADGVFYLELFHGATIAFKDMALSILPHLMTTSAKKNKIENEIVILTATSGDTGKAALAGFADVEGTKIIVFYPKNGVSPVQERQMVTQKGDNTYVVGIHGNFDDAQSGVKKIFNDKELAEYRGVVLLYTNGENISYVQKKIHVSLYTVYQYAFRYFFQFHQTTGGIPLAFQIFIYGETVFGFGYSISKCPIHEIIISSSLFFAKDIVYCNYSGPCKFFCEGGSE